MKCSRYKTGRILHIGIKTMRWLLAVSAVALTVAVCLCEEDPDAKEVIDGAKKEQAKPVAVLYLVENLRVTEGGQGPEKKDGGVVLSDPIPDDGNVPDGVYFKPADGKEVQKGTVSNFFILHHAVNN